MAPAGLQVNKYMLRNSSGMEVSVTNFGATVMSIVVPDRHGVPQQVTLGFDTLEEYVDNKTYMGPIAGRVANRIARGTFTLDGKVYNLVCNNGRNHLHGGPNGWAKLPWEVEGYDDTSVRLIYHSPDGDEGYPGNVDVIVTYRVDASNGLVIHIEAHTDAPTIINPTNHCYFNLHRDHTRKILDHMLQINADAYTPSDAELIPTGEILSVVDTPMDFREPKPVGRNINADFDQLMHAKGYDHNWVLNDITGAVRKCATLSAESSGITLDTSTNQPGVQCYTGNSLGKSKGRGGVQYAPYTGICLETQGFPDAINHPNFPSVILMPGETYLHETHYQFGLL
jgi:aldose 1-epimerase